MAFCRECGEDIGAREDECPHCGADLERDGQPRAPSSGGARWIGPALFLPAIALVVWVALNNSGSSGPATAPQSVAGNTATNPPVAGGKNRVTVAASFDNKCQGKKYPITTNGSSSIVKDLDLALEVYAPGYSDNLAVNAESLNWTRIVRPGTSETLCHEWPQLVDAAKGRFTIAAKKNLVTFLSPHASSSSTTS